MAEVTRMGHNTEENDEIALSVKNIKPSTFTSGVSQARRGRNFNARKKQRQNKLFDTSTLDTSRTWFSQEARRFSSRATHLIVQVPALQLRRIAQTSSVHSIRSETQHFVGIATLHGPLRIYRSRGRYRLFWITAMIFCCAMFIYQTYKLVELYLEKPIVSQVSFLQPEEGIEFPLVTVCSFNYINKQNLANFMRRENVSTEFITFVLQSIVDIGVLSTFINETNLSEGYEEYQRYVQRNPSFTINEFFRSSSLGCKETLRICSIGVEEFDCCAYAKVVMTDMGNCYQIDLQDHPSLIAKQIGANNGELLTIPEFLLNNEIGFRYFVHSRNDYPFITSEGIGVQLGNRIFSAISAHRFVLMKQCISEWPTEITSANLTLIKNGIGKYSSTKCVAFCLGIFFNDICGCTPFLYNYNGTFPTCTLYQNYHECLNIALNVSAESSADEILRRVKPSCLNSCKMECQRWDYQIFNSYSQPFLHSATAYLMKHEKMRKAKLDDFIGINIYYHDIAYTEYKQMHKTSMNEIWSSLGGNMGLFLGMSLLTVIEVIIYLCKISWLFVSRKRRQHMIAKKENEKRRKQMSVNGLVDAANKVAMPSPIRRLSMSLLSFGPSNESSPTTLPSPPLAPTTTVSSRLRKFASSIKRRSLEILPRCNEPEFKETQNMETPSSNKNAKNSYYLNNLITERTHGMGKAMNTRDEDVVELKLEVGSRPSIPNGNHLMVPATIKQSRTLSVSMEDRKALFKELEKRRPTNLSLQISRNDLKTLTAAAQKPPNFFQRSFNLLAANTVQRHQRTSTNLNSMQKTSSSVTKSSNSVLDSLTSASKLTSPKTTKLMEFKRTKMTSEQHKQDIELTNKAHLDPAQPTASEKKEALITAKTPRLSNFVFSNSLSPIADTSVVLGLTSPESTLSSDPAIGQKIKSDVANGTDLEAGERVISQVGLTSVLSSQIPSTSCTSLVSTLDFSSECQTSCALNLQISPKPTKKPKSTLHSSTIASSTLAANPRPPLESDLNAVIVNSQSTSKSNLPLITLPNPPQISGSVSTPTNAPTSASDLTFAPVSPSLLPSPSRFTKLTQSLLSPPLELNSWPPMTRIEVAHLKPISLCLDPDANVVTLTSGVDLQASQTNSPDQNLMSASVVSETPADSAS